jgi:hypothetical protein
MAKRKNIGYFTQYCGGKVTQRCINKAKKSDDPEIVRGAALAETMMFGGIKKKAQDGVLSTPGSNVETEEAATTTPGIGQFLFNQAQSNPGLGVGGTLKGLGKGIKGGKVGISAATDLLAKGATAVINKGSSTADDALRNDKTERTGAVVGGAVKGAGKGFDLGNKIIPGLGGVIGGAIGGIVGGIRGKRGAEKDRLASVGDLRNKQVGQYQNILSANQQFTARAGGVKLPGGKMVSLPDGGKHYIGKKHEAGGIDLKRDNIEVEGGETERKITGKNGNSIDYIFSEHHKVSKAIAKKYKVPAGSSYADIHLKMEEGSIPKNYQELAKDQETDMDAKGKDQYGDRGPEHIKRYGGRRIIAQDGHREHSDRLTKALDKYKNALTAGKSIVQDVTPTNIKKNEIEVDETGLPVNRYTPSDNMSMEDIQRILDAQGAFPLAAAEVDGGVGKRQQTGDEIMKDVGKYGAYTLAGGALLGGGAALGATGVAGNALRGGARLLKAPIQKYGQGTISNALKTVAPNVSTASRIGSGLKTALNATSLYQLPSKGKKVVEGIGKEFSEEGGDLESRLKVAANTASLLPGAKFLKAAIGNRGPTVKDALKIGKDIQGGYYGSGLLRTGMAFVPGDQNKYVSMLKDASGVAAKQGAFKNVLNYSDSKDTEYFDDAAKTKLLAEQSKSTSDKDSKTLAMNKTTKPAEKKSRYGGLKAQSSLPPGIFTQDLTTPSVSSSGLNITTQTANPDSDGDGIPDNIDADAGSGATVNTPPPPAADTTPTTTSRPAFGVFNNAEEGNAFRTWLNETDPEAAKKLDLDPQGSHTNAYIRRAWAQHGDEYEVSQSDQAAEDEALASSTADAAAIVNAEAPMNANSDLPEGDGKTEEEKVVDEVKANTPGDSESSTEEASAIRKNLRDLKRANQAIPPEAIAAMAAQSIAPIYALTKKAPRVGGYAAQSYSAPKLGRVSGEADKDRIDQNSAALLASLEGQNLGPGAAANYANLLNQSSQQKAQVDQRTKQANLQIAAQEAGMGAQASQFNIQQNQRAQEYMRNLALMQNQEEFANKFGALQALGQGVAGSMGDVMAYKSDQRVAETNVADTVNEDGTNALERANLARMEKTQKLNADLAAANKAAKTAKQTEKALKKANKAGFATVEEWETHKAEEEQRKAEAKAQARADLEQARRGTVTARHGYIRRVGQIKRTRR